MARAFLAGGLEGGVQGPGNPGGGNWYRGDPGSPVLLVPNQMLPAFSAAPPTPFMLGHQTLFVPLSFLSPEPLPGPSCPFFPGITALRAAFPDPRTLSSLPSPFSVEGGRGHFIFPSEPPGHGQRASKLQWVTRAEIWLCSSLSENTRLS